VAVGIGMGLRNPWVSAAGWPGVGVQVGFIQPSPNPYPPQRVDGLPRKFKLRSKRDQTACSLFFQPLSPPTIVLHGLETKKIGK